MSGISRETLLLQLGPGIAQSEHWRGCGLHNREIVVLLASWPMGSAVFFIEGKAAGA